MHDGPTWQEPARARAGRNSSPPAEYQSALEALADLQRHVDVLGDDLVAADRRLDGWRGRSRDTFRTGLVRELAALADVGLDLHGLRREVGLLADGVDGEDAS